MRIAILLASMLTLFPQSVPPEVLSSDIPEHLKRSPNSDGPSQVKGETPVSSKNIGRGAQGPKVAELQNQLNEWRVRNGEQPLEADGIFGPKTEAAVKEFQKAHGLDADGIAGPKQKLHYKWM